MPAIQLIAEILFAAGLLELCAVVVVRWLKRDFQWLITAEDECPKANGDSLRRFINHGYDPVLGWERKAGTAKSEPVQSVGEQRRQFAESTYTINDRNARSNPGHEHLPVTVTTYGDSFAFSRHVNDDETWQWYLSERTGTNVVNYGVGNYGIDQAFLRLQREFRRQSSKVVVMMVVPETISRIVNIWKHYSEYGNTLGFKGRFVLEDGNLKWLDNPIHRPDEFENIAAHVEWIQRHDSCYQKKFREDLITSPYTASLFRNRSRHIPLLRALLARKLDARRNECDEEVANKPWELVLKRNSAFTHELYEDAGSVELLCAVIDAFRRFVCDLGSVPVLVFASYLQDVAFLRERLHFYEPVVERAARKMNVIDLSEPLRRSSELGDLYVSRFYGAHFSPAGNRFVADHLYAELRDAGILNTGGAAADPTARTE
jgi:hypothetical protein